MTEIIHIGGLSIDPHRRIVRVDGKLVHLTKAEYKALVFMAQEPERCVGRDELLRNHYDIPQDWDDLDLPRTRTVDSAIMRLRRKIGNKYVHSVWGVGYRLVNPDTVEVAA